MWGYVRLRKTRSRSLFGRFLANWAGVSGYLFALVGAWVLFPDSGRRNLGGRPYAGEPSATGWLGGVGIALIGGLLFAAVLTWYNRGTFLDQPDPEYEEPGKLERGGA